MLGDLEHKRKVRPDRQHKFTQENGLGSHVVSARTGEMVSCIYLFMVCSTILPVTRTVLGTVQEPEYVVPHIANLTGGKFYAVNKLFHLTLQGTIIGLTELLPTSTKSLT